MQQKTIWITVFSLAVMLGAFLLFTLEPLVGKLVTPGFGGTASIWSTCLLFFQVGLLGGYLLAYSITTLDIKKQTFIYMALLVVSIFFAFLPSRDAWICNNVNNPSVELMLMLSANIALPFIILSSISIMMQTWYRYQGLGNPYPLYSVSNIGSVAALFAFPVILEPTLTVTSTSQYWTWSYIGLVAMCVFLGVFTLLKGDKAAADAEDEKVSEESDDQKAVNPPTIKDFFWWCLLSTGGSIVLLAFTTYITQDVSPIPLFWILPLGLYLATFILLFSYPKTYLKRTFAFLWMIFWLAELFVRASDQFWPLILINLSLVFLTCMVFHGEMVASKPHPKYLRHFYLSMAFGGAVGGVFVNFIAPYIFTTYLERLISIISLCLLTFYLLFKGNYSTASKEIQLKDNFHRWATPLVNVMIFLLCGLSLALAAALIAVPTFFQGDSVLAEERNFYSSIKITKELVGGKPCVTMVHGQVVHGRELETGLGTYWEPVRLAYTLTREKIGDRPLNLGIIGLGVGANVAFAKEGDSVRYYELDPKVEHLARDHFSYLNKCKAKVEVKTGDGRNVLDREDPQHFDLLLVDVFNGNAIPVHLLTKEAMQIYLKHLKPDGLIGMHVSNRYLDLVPVVSKLGFESGLETRTIRTKTTIYVLMSRKKDYFDKLPQILEENKDIFKNIKYESPRFDKKDRVWTDDYVNLLPYFRQPNEGRK